MNINKESAMRFWNEIIGKIQKTTDFTGREIAKAAYNDRNSVYAWSIDHIFPKSKGGSNEKSNLKICHMLTNEEKADKITFKANDRFFHVIKMKGKDVYEIVEITSSNLLSLRKKHAFEIWDKTFYSKEIVIDFSGRTIKKSDYNNDNSNFCWDLSYILKRTNVNNEYFENYLIAHEETLKEKQNKTSFTANNKNFQIQKIKKGIYDIICKDEIIDIYNFNQVKGYTNLLLDGLENKEWTDFVFIRMDYIEYDPNDEQEILINDSLINIISQVFKKSKCFENLNYSVVNNIFIATFNTPNKDDTKEVHQLIMYLNKFKELFNKIIYDRFGLEIMLTFLHDTFYIRTSDIYYDHQILAELNDDYSNAWRFMQNLFRYTLRQGWESGHIIDRTLITESTRKILINYYDPNCFIHREFDSPYGSREGIYEHIYIQEYFDKCIKN